MADPIVTIASAAQYQAWAVRYGLATAPTGLAASLAEATCEIQEYCGREFLPSPTAADTTETRVVMGTGGQTLYIPDALRLESVTVGGLTLSPNLYAERGTPITKLVLLSRLSEWIRNAEVTLVGRFGYAEQAALPASLIEACCMLAALRLNDSASWTHLGVRSVTAGGLAKVDYAEEGTSFEAKRQTALALLRPYRRDF